MDYYEILELNANCSKEQIKKNYHKLCFKYHPDKNDGNDEKFKEIKEAYDVLIDDEKRKKYNVQRIFKNVDFTEEDYQLLNKYYNQFINSNEFKLFQMLYRSIPTSIKTEIWNKFKRSNCNEIIKAHKSIDITQLNETITINLIVKNEDKEQNKLKIIYIFSKTGIYYLYLREFNDLTIDNLDCQLMINFL